jgi:hypothetical protein
MKKKQSREKIAAVKEKDMAFVYGSDHGAWTEVPPPPPPPDAQ